MTRPRTLVLAQGVLAAMAAIALAACGSAKGGTDTKAAAAPTTTPAAVPVATTSPPTPQARPHGYDPRRNAAADIAAAKKAAAKDGRPVLIDFGADWCPDCVVLGHTFGEPHTAALLAKYHVVTVDVGEFNRNLDVARPYVDLETSGIPALAVLAPSGRVRVATNDGQFSHARSMPASDVDAFLTKWG